MMIFRDANSLKQDYSVFASFYKIIVRDKEINCRNVCDIKRNNISKSERLDAYLILMNPGSCHPIDENYTIPKYYDWEHIDIDMVECIPDYAQYQVMKLMDNKKWNYVRILNLSDIIMGKSKDFIGLLHTIPFNEHSIFSNRRLDNRSQVMKEEAKIIASWGGNKELKELAILCKESLQNKDIVGIPYDKEALRYKYIKPLLVDQQKKVLEEFITFL